MSGAATSSSIYRAPSTPSPITSPPSLLSFSLPTYLVKTILGPSLRRRSSSQERGAWQTRRLVNWIGSFRGKRSTQQTSWKCCRPDFREPRRPTKPRLSRVYGSCDSADKRPPSSFSRAACSWICLLQRRLKLRAQWSGTRRPTSPCGGLLLNLVTPLHH